MSTRSTRLDRYECHKCKRQFTVTTKTPLHSTKLSLFKWLQAMYLIVSSSKGISSVVLARWLGITQPTAWKLGHAIRKMMDPSQSDAGLLTGAVELDKMYVGGTQAHMTGKRTNAVKELPNNEFSSQRSDAARFGRFRSTVKQSHKCSQSLTITLTKIHI